MRSPMMRCHRACTCAGTSLSDTTACACLSISVCVTWPWCDVRVVRLCELVRRLMSAAAHRAMCYASSPVEVPDCVVAGVRVGFRRPWATSKWASWSRSQTRICGTCVCVGRGARIMRLSGAAELPKPQTKGLRGSPLPAVLRVEVPLVPCGCLRKAEFHFLCGTAALDGREQNVFSPVGSSQAAGWAARMLHPTCPCTAARAKGRSHCNSCRRRLPGRAASTNS